MLRRPRIRHVEVRNPQELREVAKKGYDKFDEMNGIHFNQKQKTD